MKYNQLGRTGLFVSELCLGTMTLGGNTDAGMWSAVGAVAQDEANQLIARAYHGFRAEKPGTTAGRSY